MYSITLIFKSLLFLLTVFGTWLGQEQDYLGKSPEWLFRNLPFSKRATVGVRAPMWPSETPVWSESSVDERNLYFARSTIIGLAVETWRVKTELIIITMLHIIIITASILNLGFKTIAPKVLAHTICINRYWNIHNISSKKSSKTYCKIKLAELTAKIINLLKCWRPPTIHKILTYIKMLAP
jgi:hypothetical protein